MYPALWNVNDTAKKKNWRHASVHQVLRVYGVQRREYLTKVILTNHSLNRREM